MSDEPTLGRRKEPRFKTTDQQALRCACFHERDEPKPGNIIDISPRGLRVLCDREFTVGQAVLFELATDRSLGTFGGIVRRIEPHGVGQFLIGCELVEIIPDEILKALAAKGAISGRDDRLRWNQPMKKLAEILTQVKLMSKFKSVLSKA